MKISLLDPALIETLSKGEVRNGSTYDLKGRAMREGLFCEIVFGPERPYSCKCGKYRNSLKHKGNTCGICMVRLENNSGRREHFGHVSLIEPVVHIWYKSMIAMLLNIPPKTLDDVILCKKYLIEDPGTSKYKKYQAISFMDYFRERNDSGLKGETGGKVIKGMLKNLDLVELQTELRNTNASRRVSKRLQLVRDLIKSSVKPEWMVMDKILILPPALRPVIFMSDGTVTSSDLNDLYSRIINRNNKLKHVIKEKAPELVTLNGRRLLQVGVDALIQNGKTIVSKDRSGKRILKSLTDIIQSKKGRLRRNLLGKRVDFSGRSVIAPGPSLKLHQCGVPKDLAMDLFRPFVYSRLVRKGYASSLKHARRLVDMKRAEAMEALEEEVEDKVVLLNRAPSLHRISFQAFYPVLIEGKALRLHPFTCAAFNGDFDGDQMGIHLPISHEAQVECRLLAGSIYNIFSPATGKPVALPSQEVVLGIYYLTKDRKGCLGEGKVFSDREDVETAFQHEAVELHARVKVRIAGEIVDTTVGRVLFSFIFPSKFPFKEINKTIRKKDIGKLVERCYDTFGHRETISLLDRLKDTGFHYATLSGISICIEDATVPKEKWEIISEARKAAEEVKEEYNLGQITETERYSKVVKIWTNATESVTEKTMENLGIPQEHVPAADQAELREWNSIFMMADSGARGAKEQIRQLAGMRGLMAKTTGEIVEFPIISNLREGQTYLEYLLASHGARKARADGALKTANAGYFTRKLVEAGHHIVIQEVDCGSIDGIELMALFDGESMIVPLKDRLVGRIAASDIKKPGTGEIIVRRGELFGKKEAEEVEAGGVVAVSVRSPLTCKAKNGICVHCYGLDISSRRLVEIGEAVGIIAAQSIGEPGTQLTLRSHHHGGVAAGGTSKAEIIVPRAGVINYQGINSVRYKTGQLVVTNRAGRLSLINDGHTIDLGMVPYGATISADDGGSVETGQTVAQWDPHAVPIVATISGHAEFMGIVEGVTMRDAIDTTTGLSSKTIVAISGNNVPRVMIKDKLFYLPIGTVLSINEREFVNAGDVIARIPKGVAKSMDITGGLPKVLQLLEVRLLRNAAILSEISGEIEVKLPTNKTVIVLVKADVGVTKTYSVPIEKVLNVHTGDIVMAGDAIVDGVTDPRDILRIRGPVKTALYIVDEVQKIYMEQGVSIADKHFEVITKEMLRMVRITNPGETDFVHNEIVSKEAFLEGNKHITTGKLATAAPVLIGLAKIGKLSDSWLSAASFEYTVNALSEAAVKGRTDYLKGTKENVILGRMVPTGTGYPLYKNTTITPSRIRKRSD